MKRKIILGALIALAFIWLLISRYAEIEKIAVLLVSGQGQWILTAALLQAAYYVVYTAMFSFAFAAVDVESRVKELLPVTFGSLFINTITPTWGMAGVALFIDDLYHRGQPPARSAAGALLAQSSDYIAFAAIMFAGMAYLFYQGDLSRYEVLGGAVLLLAISGLSGVLLLGLRRPKILKRLMELVQSGIEGLALRLRRKPPLEKGWADRSSEDFVNAARAIKARPYRLGHTLSAAMAAHLINIASLYFIFLAYHQKIGLGPLIAGYAIGILFWDISPVPQGIGVVEGVIALTLISFGVPGTTATVISLAFRGLDFWLPMFLGFLLLRRVRIFESGR